MSYSAPNRLMMSKRHSLDSLGDSWFFPYMSFTSVLAWGTANLAIYVPLRVPSPVVVKKLWCSATTTGTGNVSMALYDQAGVAVISPTSAARLASATEQVLDVTDTLIAPGRYYIGISSDSATDTFYASIAAAPLPAAFGVLTESSAYPLPSTATFAFSQTLAKIPIVGVLIEGTVA